MTGLVLAVLALALAGGALGLWFRWLRQVALEGRRRVVYALLALAAALAVAAFAAEPGALGGTLAAATLVVSAAWVGLGLQAPQSRQAPAVAVGEAVPDFTAPDEEGRPFRLADLRGRPVLLKFFRGHW